jgi:hypothetical protein
MLGVARGPKGVEAMDAKIVSAKGRSVTLQVSVDLDDTSMLASERRILAAVNELGCLATAEAIRRFDTNGEPIIVEGTRMTTKGRTPKEYQTPYGPITLLRHTYQSAAGGKTFCPADDRARVFRRSTPWFAKMISHKSAENNQRRVVEDLSENHGRQVALCFVQDLAEGIGAVAQATEVAWEYEPPTPTATVKTVTVGLDGTCMLMVDGNWRQAMVGTIGLYDRHGERLHTTYIGAAPEPGKKTFLDRLDREFKRARDRYPKALFIGLADGAPSNWEFLDSRVEVSVLDFYHVTEYLTKFSDTIFAKDAKRREEWLEKACHRLKHDLGAPAQLTREMVALNNAAKLKAADRKIVDGVIGYFRNNRRRMPYSRHTRADLPIGSGVTEAGCKVIIKQRLCCSGMKWKAQGAGIVIALRCLARTPTFWNQFWGKIEAHGYQIPSEVHCG